MKLASVDGLAESLAVRINKHHPESSSVAVLKYGLIAIINEIIVMASVLLLGAFTGKLTDTVVAMLAFPALRYFSGGFHMNSSAACNVITVTFLLIAIYTPIHYANTGLLLTALALLPLLIYAPSGIKRSRLDKKYYPVLKLIALLIVCTNFFVQSHILAMVFFIQSLTTLRIFQKDSL